MTRTAALAAALATLLPACRRSDAGPAARRPIAVHVATAAARDVPLEVSAVGKIVSNQSVAIRAQVSGALVASRFTEGRWVKQGTLLLEIDRRPHAAALAEAKGRLEQDRAKAENARADAKRYAGLVEKEFVPRQQYDAAVANAASLEAAVVADEAAVQRAALDLAYCEVRAPISGRTGRLLVQVGNLVNASSPEPLLTIEQVKPVFAQFSIPERWLPALRARKGAVPVRVRPQGGGEVTGTLDFLDNAVDATTGTILVKARVANEDEALLPGQVIDVSVRIADRANVIVVPSAAVAQGQQGDYAYVVAGGKAELRPVVVEQAGDRETVISKGLGAGETVVTEGQLKLKPGDAVEVLREEAAKR